MVERATHVLVLLALVAAASGLTCRVCNGTSDYDCVGTQECGSNEVCQTDYTRVGDSVTLTKQCRHRRECNKEQSMFDDNCQENQEGDEWRCKCCCDTDECNSLDAGCHYPNDCNAPEAPENGYVDCPWRMRTRARCTFHCDDGYELDGNKFTTCRRISKNGTLALVPNRVPTCVKKQPEPAGLTCMVCDGSSNDDCTESQECGPSEVCQNDFYIPEYTLFVRKSCKPRDVCEAEVAAQVNSTCDEVEGDCICCCDTDNCNSPERGCLYAGDCAKPRQPENGYADCPLRMRDSDKCQFSCHYGYTLEGNSETTCQTNSETGAMYLLPNTVPKCVEKPSCASPEAPENGLFECSFSLYEGDACSFRCDDGYDLVGTRTVTCERDSETGNLSLTPDDVPSCVPTPKPEYCTKPAAPENGYVSCPYRIQDKSKCSFYCNYGYALEGNSETICQRDYEEGALALVPKTVPSCVKSVPRCEQLAAPENGKVKCKNADEYSDMDEYNYQGSKCKFKCARYHILIGKKKTACKYIDGELLWSNLPPRCFRPSCPPLEDNNNLNTTCTEGNLVGSKCTQKCAIGFTVSEGGHKCKMDYSTKGENGKGKWVGKTAECLAVFIG